MFLEVSSEFSLILPLNEKPVKGKLFSEKNILKMMTFVFNPNCFYITREIQGKGNCLIYFSYYSYSIPGFKTKTGKKGGGIFLFPEGA